MSVTREDPPFVAGERDMLDAFLAFQQQTLLLKIDGLSEADLRRSFVPSGTSFLALVKHLAYVHRWWFRAVFAGEQVDIPWQRGDESGDWRIEANDTVASLVAFYQDEVALARAITRAAQPDDIARHPAIRPTLRWVLTHMVEEVARHNGHADFTRELIDGSTGE